MEVYVFFLLVAAVAASPDPEPETVTYLGCYREDSVKDRLLNGDLQNFPTNNTHEVCIDYCRSNGFLYAGVQFGRQCFCSNERPSYDKIADSESECNMPCSGDSSEVCGGQRRLGVYSLLEPERELLTSSYIGCYAGGALEKEMGQCKNLSLEACMASCEEDRYRYFGATQGSKCYCGNGVASNRINESECNVPCGGDSTQLCGGSSEQLSLYITSIPEPETVTYLGCYREDSVEDRLLQGGYRNFVSENTHEVCINYCWSKGFLFAGVQYGRQCFCANERPSYDKIADHESECNMPCSGDSSEVCGGQRRLNVFSLIDPKPELVSSSYIGCYAGGALQKEMGQSKNLSLEACMASCEANRYIYFGATQGSKCYCGNGVASNRINESECTVPCGGDSTQLCGGSSDQLVVYKTSTPEPETVTYLGCFRERSVEDRLFKGDYQNFVTRNTPEICINYCWSEEFLFAGVQYGRQCFCSNERPSYEMIADHESECKTPCSGNPSEVCGGQRRLGVYALVDPVPESLSSSYIGCYDGGSLQKEMGQSKNLSLEACMASCEEDVYTYFGATQGSKCYCGNGVASNRINESECNVPCGGDSTQLCGGSSEQLSVYRTSPPEPETGTYLGCFRERDSGGWLFTGAIRNFDTKNTQEVCITYCRGMGLLFAGVEFSRHCFCSNERPPEELLVDSEGECNMTCAGDPSEFCGGRNRMDVFGLADPEPESMPTSYIGCYAGGALQEEMGQNDFLFLDTCRVLCEANYYKYFGAAQGTNCFCGNDIVRDSVSEGECRVPCGGNKNQLCGGSSDQLSVYRTSIPDGMIPLGSTIGAPTIEATVSFSTDEETGTQTEPVFTSTTGVRQTERPNIYLNVYG